MPHDVVIPNRILNKHFNTQLDWPTIRFPIRIQQMYVPGCIVYDERMLPDACFDRFQEPCKSSISIGKPVNLIELSTYLVNELTRRLETLDLEPRPIVIQCTSKCSGLKLLLELWFPVQCLVSSSTQITCAYDSVLFPNGLRY